VETGIAGKVALVAAGSKGIGLATAKMLQAEGCRVSICSRQPKGDEADHTFACDLSMPDQIEAWLASAESALGPCDILVTNTGGPPAGALADITDEQWALGIESTLMNVVRLSRFALPGMMARGWGRVVHVTSLAAHEPSPMLPISSTLRAGINALTKLQATDCGPHGVTVNAVLPGHTMTDRQVHLAEIIARQQGITVEEALAQQAAKTGMKRIADVDEIAAPIVFLCSQAASYVSGVSLLVDGATVKGI